MPLQEHIDRRRTFAIISHPDAGKTTLTEKLLLYGGAVQLAGSVTQRKNQRASTSDWMELERQRGISISSTVLQFEYRDRVINLLDTPGHKDFSEDTYRVLTAVDAAIMVIDAGKGIETQTRKLFEVCRKRGVPIFTFMNKMDREAIAPIELLDELESVLGIPATAMNWPLGMGRQFKGVFDRRTRDLHLFERTAHGAYRAPVQVGGLHDAFVESQVEPDSLARARDEIETLDGAGHAFDHAAVLAGRLTPVFFGSAANNFGVQLLLDSFVDLAPGPAARMTADGEIRPDDARFSGFVFKIQANMDPRHRDRIYFIRLVSGRFERDMNAVNTRTGKAVRLSNAQRVFARTRETLDEGYAGDVIGIVGNHDFHIGDTVSDDPVLKFDEIPRFPPECFALLQNPNPSNFKRFREGLGQLLQEGVIQQFMPVNSFSRVPLLGAVGPLQFEVVQYRLQSEYNAESRLEPSPYKLIRWLRRKDGQPWTDDIPLPSGSALVRDILDRPAAVFTDQWPLKFFTERNEAIEQAELPF
ncbi:MAG: peptide chain release factor 3 [Kiritimatiellia bacterium]